MSDARELVVAKLRLGHPEIDEWRPVQYSQSLVFKTAEYNHHWFPPSRTDYAPCGASSGASPVGITMGRVLDTMAQSYDLIGNMCHECCVAFLEGGPDGH